MVLKKKKKGYEDPSSYGNEERKETLKGNRDSKRRSFFSSSSVASEFFRLYVLDWRTLAAVAVPAGFCLLFAPYWYGIHQNT